MTEQEQKAIKWMKNVRDNAVVTLDHIAKEEPNVSPMLYAGRKEKAETIINGFEELEKYRAIGTTEECMAAVDKQTAKKPMQQGVFDNKGVFHTWNGINGKPYLLCPACKINLCCEMPGDRKPKYCNNCGTKLDWSDEE